MTNENIILEVEQKYHELFHGKPIYMQAPGRINLIGEHTDYNDGFVLPAAINMSIYFALAENNENIFRFYSLDFVELYSTKNCSINIDTPSWVKYLLGVISQFQKIGIDISGVDCVFGGDIPIGAGLSSSAALECGFALGLNKIFRCKIQKYDLVRMSQKAEHEYAGVMCGIMDQFASMFGKKDHVFKLDCRSHEHNYFPLAMKDHTIALVNTKVEHELASSEYNKRRQECEEGVRVLVNEDIEIQSLRDAKLEILEGLKDKFNPKVYRRCHYVISENLRVIEACHALNKSDYGKFGQLMYKSHDGLKNDYEVSCKELDILVEATHDIDYVLGSRMMGGGFGGCTINLIKAEKVAQFEEEISYTYKEKTGINPEFYFVKLNDGVRVINQ